MPPAPARPGATTSLLERPAVIAGAVALLVATGLIPQFLSRTLPDIAFLLYASGRALDGARLYVDLIEVNPPLIVWLNLPVVAVARAIGAADVTVYRIAVAALLAMSVLACRWVIARTADGREPAFRGLFLLSVVAALFVLPRLDWGEREHLTLALVLPYILLTIVRLERGAVRAGPAAAIGLAAAVGIAIKPHFVLLWFVREGVLMATRRRRPSLEGVVIVAAGGLYLLAALLATPDYFCLVRELGPAYQAYVHNSLPLTALIGDGAGMSLGALVLTAALWRHQRSRSLHLTLVLGVAAFYVAAVLQLKGWRYHFYPALALAWIVLVVLAVRARRPLARWTERVFAAVAGAAALTVLAAAVTGCVLQAADPLHPRYDADPSIGPLLAAVADEVRGRDLVVLSPNMASGFPLATYAGARWPQRLSNLWPLVAAYDSAIRDPAPFRLRPPDRMSALERMVLGTVSEDLSTADAPILLVLRRGPDEPRWGMRRIDLVTFLSRDERLARFLAGYEPAGIVGQYDMYRRRDRPGPPRLLPSGSGGAAAPGEIAFTRNAALVSLVFGVLLAALYRRELTATG
jgi:hypothetical protein